MYLSEFKEFCKEAGDEHIGDVCSTELEYIYSIHKVGDLYLVIYLESLNLIDLLRS